MNVVLAAEEAAGLQVLLSVARSKHRLLAVITTPPSNESTATSIWRLAERLGVEAIPAKSVKDPRLADRLRSVHLDILLNVYSLYIVHPNVLAAPRLGAFNMHPGPLPRYAGLNSVSWAIYQGERTHGVTIHKMDALIDTGPIAYQSQFPIADCDTALSISFKCVREGVRLMRTLLDVAAAEPDHIPLRRQDLSLRQYFGRQVPNNGRISWCWPAGRVVDFVRACDYFPFHSPWGHPKAWLNGLPVEVLKASRTGASCHVQPGMIGARSFAGVHVACLDEWISVEQLKIGEERVRAVDVLNGGEHFKADVDVQERC